MADAAPPQEAPPPTPPEPSPEPSPEPTGTVDESTLLPVERDWRFVYRLVGLLLVGLIAATFLGWKLKGVAAGCGADLVRPGSTVIPPSNQPR